MGIINEITVNIVKNAKDGENIRGLAAKIGFAYSAVYRWISELEKYGVINLIRKGNKNIIKINKNMIYNKFKELDKVISVIEKDSVFWNLIKRLKLRVRFVKGTAVTILTRGSFVTGDFYDRIYFLEVERRDMNSLKNALRKNGIVYTEDKINNHRPLVYISQKEKLNIERKNGLPVMPVSELVSWCKKLYLENILEQLNDLYNLGLKVKYADISTNV